MDTLRILALEPYAAVSHQTFLDGLEEYSSHRWTRIELPGHHWKWRMRTSSLILSPEIVSRWQEGEQWDLIFASEYLNLAELISLLPVPLKELPTVTFFHENQLTFPLQGDERRDVHFTLTHVHSILASRSSWFNSAYHRNQFLQALPAVLDQVPGLDTSSVLREVRASSRVMYLGTAVEIGNVPPCRGQIPIVLWPHRWEYDKDPELMVDTVLALREEGLNFRLRLLGPRSSAGQPGIEKISRAFGDDLEAPGFLPDRNEYIAAISGCDIVLSTARHEFFGIAVLEGLRRGAMPVLPSDLAYRELLPPGLATPSRYLWERSDGPAATLKRALSTIEGGSWLEERQQIVEGTDRFCWSSLAGAYDEAFSSVVSGEIPASFS